MRTGKSLYTKTKTQIRQGSNKNFEFENLIAVEWDKRRIYSKTVTISSNKHPLGLFNFEVLRLQHLFQNKKNHLHETLKAGHRLFSSNNKWLSLWYIVLRISELLVIFIFSVLALCILV